MTSWPESVFWVSSGHTSLLALEGFFFLLRLFVSQLRAGLKGRETFLSSEQKEISESMEEIERGESGGEDESNERSRLEENTDVQDDDYGDNVNEDDCDLGFVWIVVSRPGKARGCSINTVVTLSE